jgi:phosphoserine phosphatase
VVKYAFVDVDGTLTTGLSSWELVHRHFNLIDEMEDHSARFYNGEITYDEWAHLDVALWKGRPYAELNAAVNPPELIKGAKEGIDLLKLQGYHVVLLSGGIDVMVDEVKRQVGANEAYSNQIGQTNGIIDGSVYTTVGIKSIVIRQIMESNGHSLESSIAIGDNVNDVEMFELSHRTVAINPKSDKIVKVADHVIETDNFIDAVKLALQ